MECPKCNSPWSSDRHIPRILHCGHTFCEECAKSLFSICKIQCLVCQNVHQFTIDRKFDDSNDSFTMKCINSMPKNFTLLSLSESRASTSTNQFTETEDLDIAVCEEHNLPLHSYTEKPYSLLCDKCIEDISEYELIIKPIPEVSNYFTEKLKEISTNLTKQKKDCEFMIENYSKMEELEIENTEKALNNYFENCKNIVEDVKNEIKLQLQSLVQEQELSNIKQTGSKENSKKLLKDFENQYRYFKSLSSSELVKWVGSFDNLIQSSLPISENCEKMAISLSTNKALVVSIQELMNSSYEISIQKTILSWTCDHCEKQNIDGAIQCVTCFSFRPLASYPNVLKSPNQANSQEIYELNVRRQLELQLISELDKNDIGNLYYLIHASWINKWKDYIFNKKTDTNLSPLGILPPGPITNNLLFVDSECTSLKPKLKAAIDYRGLNQKVWEAYYNIYGGGPVIARRKLNIYEDHKHKH